MRQPVDLREPRSGRVSTREQPELLARLLGPLMITLDGRVVDTASSRRTRNVLSYLLLHRRGFVARDVLMDVFWPDARPAAARNNLHVALTGVRRALHAAWPGTVLQRQHDSYRLGGDATVWVDVEEFQRRVRAGRRADHEADPERALAEYSAADRLYEGDLLAEDPYADWASFGRDSVRLDLLDVQRRLAQLHAEAGDHASAVLVARRALATDPCNEIMHRRLMQGYRDTGQLHLALSQYHRCAEQLWATYRVRPTPETARMYEQLRCPQQRRTA
jgi:SARP family transcriptional regulator, regulator of embCAB operon